MSIPHILARVTNRPLLLEPTYGATFFSALSGKAGISELKLDENIINATDMQSLVDSYKKDNEKKKPYAVIDNIAWIPVEGTLAYKTSNLQPTSGMTGYDGLKANLSIAESDPEVQAILLDISSPGGEVSGITNTVNAIKSSTKPVYSFTGQTAASAAFWIGSAAKEFYADETSRVGSIGAIIAVTNSAGALAQEGISVEFIRSGKRKAEVNGVEQLTPEARESLQTEVERAGMMFAESVAENRKVSLETVLATEAAMLSPEQALTLGLIDGVMSIEDVVAKIKLDLNNQKENIIMDEAQLVEAKAQGAALERARIQAILGTGHPGATHLAFNTSMASEEAIGLLSAIPVPAAKEATPPQSVDSPLKALEAHTVVPADVVPQKQPITTANLMTPDGKFSIGAAVAALKNQGV